MGTYTKLGYVIKKRTPGKDFYFRYFNYVNWRWNFWKLS